MRRVLSSVELGRNLCLVIERDLDERRCESMVFSGVGDNGGGSAFDDRRSSMEDLFVGEGGILVGEGGR